MKIQVTFYSKAVLTSNDGADCEKFPWSLFEDLICYVNDTKIVVPAGFKTDIASIPQPVHWFCREYGRLNEAAVLHDMLYAAEIFPRGLNDDIFRAGLIARGIPEWRANVMWGSVRAFGGITYPLEHTPPRIAEIRSSAGFVDKTTRPLFKNLLDFCQMPHAA